MKFLVALSWLGIAIAPYMACAEDNSFERLTVDQVEQKLNEGNVFVFDNNSEKTYKNGHLPNAKHVTPSKLTAADLPADKDATLIFYCANEKCLACHDGAKAAVKLGYKNVFIMPAGIEGWKKAGKTIVKD